jgi:hypothetical protein
VKTGRSNSRRNRQIWQNLLRKVVTQMGCFANDEDDEYTKSKILCNVSWQTEWFHKWSIRSWQGCHHHRIIQKKCWQITVPWTGFELATVVYVRSGPATYIPYFKITALSDVTPCSLVKICQSFGETCSFHRQGRVTPPPRWKTTGSSETLPVYQTT